MYLLEEKIMLNEYIFRYMGNYILTYNEVSSDIVRYLCQIVIQDETYQRENQEKNANWITELLQRL